MPIKITKRMRKFIGEQNSLGFVATCDKENRPNIVPKAILAVSEDTLLYADLFADRTAENVRENNSIAIAFINPAQCSGYQFKGQASILNRGAAFEIARQKFAELGFKEPVYAVELNVDEIFFFEQGPEARMEAA
jgi:predicted pyridoxine 5'-phosphate oxidase superfamily flavin-nucleotide-binding protein